MAVRMWHLAFLWCLVVCNVWQQSAADGEQKLSLETLYKELRNRSSDEVTLYLLYSFYAANDNSNLFNVDANISNACQQTVQTAERHLRSLAYGGPVWNGLKFCTSDVAYDIRNNVNIVLQNPIEYVCKCLDAKNATVDSYEVTFVTEFGYYFDRLPANKSDATDMLFEQLSSKDLALDMVLNLLYNSSDSVYYHQDLYILFEVIKSAINHGDDNITKQMQDTFSLAVVDSAHTLVEGLRIAKTLRLNQTLNGEVITENMQYILSENLIARFSEHPILKYQFLSKNQFIYKVINKSKYFVRPKRK